MRGGAHGLRKYVYQTANKAAAVLTNGQVLFTVSGGPVMFKQILGICKTGNDATASTVLFAHTPTVGGASNMSIASASLANVTAGATVAFGAQAATNAPAVSANGYQNISDANGGLLTEGTVSATVGVGSTTGTWEWILVYEPLTENSTVS